MFKNAFLYIKIKIKDIPIIYIYFVYSFFWRTLSYKWKKYFLMMMLFKEVIIQGGSDGLGGPSAN